MNFLNADKGYFSYKYGLYSAGHAQLDLEKTIKQLHRSSRQKNDLPDMLTNVLRSYHKEVAPQESAKK